MDQYSDNNLCNFIGIYDKNLQYKTGDIVIKNGEPYLYINNCWELIEYYKDSNSNVPLNNMEMVINKCPSCGAPLDPNESKCHYCDSIFMKRVVMKA